MIDREKAKKEGINAIDGGIVLRQYDESLHGRLEHLLADAIANDGQVSIEALQDAVNTSSMRCNDQGYELTFPGKGLAQKQASSSTDFELRAELKQSKDFDNSSNVIIRADNLDALKILYQNYFGKIKMIYIDPPYNTQSEDFVYKDNFRKSDADLIQHLGMKKETIDFLHDIYGTRSRSGWLAFMYPRLKLARHLLREDGVIFISIDDNQHADLKLICDEIFGENFIACLHVEMSSTQGMKVRAAQKGKIVKNGEYVLAYGKDEKNVNFNPLYEKRGWDDHYSIYYNKESGENCSLLNFLKEKKEDANIDDDFKYKKMGDYYGRNIKLREFVHSVAEHIWRSAKCDINLKLSEEQKTCLNDSGIVPYKSDNKTYYLQQTSTKKIRQLLPLSQSIGETDGFEKFYGIRKIRGDWWDGYFRDMMNINKEGGVIFNNGKKPLRLIKDLIKMTTNNETADIVLDFFAGSGTTGEAVMQLNKKDRGNRKFILVQCDEKINQRKNKETYNLCKNNDLDPVISSVTIERINRAGEKIGENAGGGGIWV